MLLLMMITALYSKEKVKAPSDLKVIKTTQNSVTIEWKDNSDNEEGFRIYKKKTGKKTYTLIATVGKNVTVYTDSGLSSSTSYEYKVVSFYKGEENFSGIAKRVTLRYTKKYEFKPAAWFEIEQKDPYTMHIKTPSNEDDGFDDDWRLKP